MAVRGRPAPLIRTSSVFVAVMVLSIAAGATDSSRETTEAPPPQLIRQGLVLPTGAEFDSLQAAFPSVLRVGGSYQMWYFGCTPSYYCRIVAATSLDGRSWWKYGPVLIPTLPAEGSIVAYQDVRLVDGVYRMWYTGFDGSRYRIFAADSPNGLNWTKRGVVLDVGPPGSEDANGVFAPRVLYDGTTYRMWYTTAQTVPASVLYATSFNGLAWTKQDVALRGNASDPSQSYGVGAPTVVEDGGGYLMIYTGQSSVTASRLFYARSTNGVTWQQLGLALDALPPQESLIAGPNAVVEADGTLSVYYTARSGSSDLQIYLATSRAPAEGPDSPDSSGSVGVSTLIAPVVIVIYAGAVGLISVALFLLRADRRSRPP